jgi:hypothetical protein
MRSATRTTFLRATALLSLAGAGLTLAVQQIACSSGAIAPVEDAPQTTVTQSPADPGRSDAVGSLGMALTLPGGESINSINWVITGPNGASTAVTQGTVNLQNSLSVSFVVSNIPAGSNYTIALSGTSVDGTVTCAGAVQFDISARATTSVSDLLQCNAALSEAGSLLLVGQAYDCAAWSGVTVFPSETSVSGSVAISATATAVNPAAVTYAWSAPSGSFSAPTSASTNFVCTTPGTVTLTLTVGDGPVPDGGSCNPALTTTTTQVVCDAVVAQGLVTTLGAGVVPTAVTINQGTGIGKGTGATPAMLVNLAADPNNTQTIASSDGGPPFLAAGTVPDTAAGFCAYPVDGGAPTRIAYATGSSFETTATDPNVPLSPAYFPLVYNTTNTSSRNTNFGDAGPIVGLFDWRPKDIDESLLVAESDDNGKSWYFMQNVLELNPDYTNPTSGGFSAGSTNTGCPATLQSTNANFVGATGSQADDGWGHATIIQLPGSGNVATGQFLYLLDRNTNDIAGSTASIVDNAPLHAINITGSSNKFPIWNTNNANPGANDIRSISSTLQPTVDGGANFVKAQNTVGLLNPDGIMAVFPMPATTPAGAALTVMYVQKILDGDNTGSTALPAAQRCNSAPFSGKSNHDISNVRLATTTDGVNFTDEGIVQGLNDPTTVDYNGTRWISPRGTLLDINGDGSLWGLYFSGGNCLDGDSDAFHYIGYAESTDKVHWVVYNDINSPIASINPITTTNQATGTTVTVPAHPPVIPTQPWFAERLYAPTATQIDSTHLAMTFAGYGVQTPADDLLEYRQIGNVVLTVSKALPPGVPNNINAH